MPRETYVLRDGACIPKRLAGLPPRGPASGLARPMVIGDTCEFRSMADGRVYTSKSAYRADLRARGLVEVGNDSSLSRGPSSYEPANVEQDIARAYDQVVGA